MSNSPTPAWATKAAEAQLADGTATPPAVVTMITGFLSTATDRPLKGAELDIEALALFEAWSPQETTKA